tara:strand:- start:50 stop:367 length:318 start_codon:yes stop_codon:yes gene_type:complete
VVGVDDMVRGYVRGRAERMCTECGSVRTRVGGKCELSIDLPVKSVTCDKTGESHIVRSIKFVCQGRLLKLDNPHWNHNEPDYELRSKRMTEARESYRQWAYGKEE